MYIDIVPNRNSPPAVLLRRSWREGGKIKKETVANLSSLPMDQVHQLRRVLKGETLVPAEEAFEVVRSRPHGHVAAVVGTMKKLGIPELLSTSKRRERELALAMIAARILDPSSKLATAQKLGLETLSSSLAEVLSVEDADADDLYGALDWLRRGQKRIEKKLAAEPFPRTEQGPSEAHSGRADAPPAGARERRGTCWMIEGPQAVADV